MPRRKSNLQVISQYEDEVRQPQKNNQCKIKIDDLKTIGAMTETQGQFFSQYSQGAQAMLLHGSAGTGKTFIALYKALEEVLDPSTQYEKVVIIRSAVASRDIGHLPGDQDEKSAVYMQPYIDMCEKLIPQKKGAWKRLIDTKAVEWMITSFVRGITLDDSIVIVDECQNMNDMELNSVLTRLGENSKIVLCGDFRQSDLYKHRGDMSGLQKFMVIAEDMKSFKIIEFTADDIVRSKFVREYIMARMRYEDAHGS
jgi:phosphate starvation-inducible protein PhoH|tara:strand:- start:944 stop:1708 length:765 start_codon:yes stop_codon:yes gene_type:complete